MPDNTAPEILPPIGAEHVAASASAIVPPAEKSAEILPSAPAGDDGLEIPSFLKKQANQPLSEPATPASTKSLVLAGKEATHRKRFRRTRAIWRHRRLPFYLVVLPGLVYGYQPALNAGRVSSDYAASNKADNVPYKMANFAVAWGTGISSAFSGPAKCYDQVPWFLQSAPSYASKPIHDYLITMNAAVNGISGIVTSLVGTAVGSTSNPPPRPSSDNRTLVPAHNCP